MLDYRTDSDNSESKIISNSNNDEYVWLQEQSSPQIHTIP